MYLKYQLTQDLKSNGCLNFMFSNTVVSLAGVCSLLKPTFYQNILKSQTIILIKNIYLLLENGLDFSYYLELLKCRHLVPIDRFDRQSFSCSSFFARWKKERLKKKKIYIFSLHLIFLNYLSFCICYKVNMKRLKKGKHFHQISLKLICHDN